MKTEIEIPVAELKTVLPGLAKIVGRSSTLPVLNRIKVALDKEEQFISLQANNLDEIATVRLPNKANGLSGELLLPLETLTKIVKGCPAEQSVRFIASETETKIRYTVAGNSVDRVVEHTSPAEWPPVELIDQDSFPLDDAFKQALKEAMDCASVDSSRYVLNGACLDVSAKEAHYVVGTDGRHLYSANSFQFGIPESLIVPTCKFVVWPAFLNDGPWKLRMLPAVKANPEDKKADKSWDEPAWFRIESDRWTYLARAIDGTYPNWKQVVPDQTVNWTRVTLAPTSVQMMQQALPLLPGADSSTQTIVLESANNQLALRARGRDDQEDTRMEVPDVRIVGRPFEVALNRTFLLQAFRFGLNEIRIHDSLSPLVCSSPNKMMIIMPIRLDGPAGPPAPAPVESPTGPSNTSPTENTAAVPPSAAAADHPAETETQTMTTTTATSTPERGHLRANHNGINNDHDNGHGNGGDEEKRSSFQAALEHLDRIKTNVREVVSALSEAASLLKTAEKEQRATNKEIDTVRSKLREIQSVKI